LSSTPQTGGLGAVGTPFWVQEGAVFFLTVQRPRYRWQPLYRLFSLLGLGGVYKRRVTRSFVERRRAEAIGRLYAQDVEETLARVAPHLPPRVESVVDIGCGIGGMSLGLWRRFPESIRSLYLLDRSEVTPSLYMGFRKEAAFYNSLEETERFLLGNGVPREVIRIVDVSKAPFPEVQADVAISTFAWGFHFPVDRYVEAVRRALRPEGVVALHVRREKGGEELLREHFEEVTVIHRGKSGDLIVAKRPRRGP
jgi:SAM-dependent methyltransferase